MTTTIQDAVEFIRSRIKTHPQFADTRFDLGVILGSGLGQFANHLEQPVSISYDEIPGFKPCGVEGHAGKLIAGTIEGKKLLCQQGRYHFYEGHPMSDVVFPVRVMAGLGIKNLLVTNASGGINQTFGAGDIMLIEDHLNFMGTNPLIGPNNDAQGTRFPDMSFAYNPEHRQKLCEAAEHLEITLRKGVYLAVTGPSYETPAEIKMFRTLGADVVGMSTVPECIVANHAGLKVLGLSCVANPAAGLSTTQLTHEEVKEVIGRMSRTFEALVIEWIKRL